MAPDFVKNLPNEHIRIVSFSVFIVYLNFKYKYFLLSCFSIKIHVRGIKNLVSKGLLSPMASPAEALH